MPLAKRDRMLRQPLALALGGCLMVASANQAEAAGTWLSGGSVSAVEQRVAVAVGPTRTTLWTSLRFTSAAGPLGIVIPVPPLSALDISSDAWFEALEVATAMRVFPPNGIDPYCPGDSGDPGPYEIAGSVDHKASLMPSEVTVLADAPAVAFWAASRGLTLTPEVAGQLGGLQGQRFVAALFAAPGGEGLTKSLRIAMPSGQPPQLPLALTYAGNQDLLVTVSLIGTGRGALDGTTPITIDPSNLVWNANDLVTNYIDERLNALILAGPTGALLEASSHGALSYSISLGGTASIDGVILTYFDRADMYGDGANSPTTCTSAAAVALESNAIVATSCPRADYGIVDGVDTCVESLPGGTTDPNKLRCGGITDDIAVALSDLTPADTWLSRYTLRIAAGQAGLDWPVTFSSGAAVIPKLTSESVTLSDCGGADAGPDGSSSGPGGTSSSTTGAGPSGGTGAGAGDPGTVIEEYDQSSTYVGCSCSGPETVVIDDGGEDTTSDDSCSSDTSAAGEDDSCSSDTAESTSSDEGCSGDTTDTGSGDESCDGSDSAGSEDCSSDSGAGSDGCSGDSGGGESCDSGGGSEGCDSGGGDASCDSGSSSDCSLVSQPRAKKRRGPKMSILLLGSIALLFPIRRAGRNKARGERRKAPAKKKKGRRGIP